MCEKNREYLRVYCICIKNKNKTLDFWFLGPASKDNK